MDDFENMEQIPLTEEEAGFQVDNDQKAEWCLRKIKEEQAEVSRWKAFYAEQLRRLEERSQYRIGFFEDKLKMYFSMVPHKESRTQSSYQLPGGKLVYKRQAPEIVRNDAQLLPWVKANQPEMVKVSEAVDWASLKKSLSINEDLGMAMTEEGEIVPGITVNERPDIFKVEVK